MTDNNNNNGCWVIWIIVFLFGFIIPSIGLCYRSLRFAANYQITTGKIVDCNSEYKKDNTGRYYIFDIYVEGIDYPIMEISPQIRPKYKEAFKRMPPEEDWCGMVGEKITVYHYDKVETGTAFKEVPKKMSFLKLFWNIETGAGAIGFFLLIIITIIAVGVGIYLFIKNIMKVYASIPPVENIGNSIALLWIKRTNRQILPLVSIILASILLVLLGSVWFKGMLYVEGRSNFFMGLILFLSFALVIFGPALLVRGIHLMRTTKNEVIKFLKNVIFIGGFAKLIFNISKFLVQFDFASFNNNDIKSFMIEIWKVIFS